MHLMEKFLSTGEVARILNKSKEMVHKYIKQKKLIPDAITGINNYLFRELTVLEFQSKQKDNKINGK
jgi:Helix-turn-helix domain